MATLLPLMMVLTFSGKLAAMALVSATVDPLAILLLLLECTSLEYQVGASAII